MANRSSFENEALEYHNLHNKPGKISIKPTKPLNTQNDLSLAYSPGVAYPCLEINKDPSKAYDYTSKGNMVAVITNGTAVLGLGDLGALASKPVMEGKSVLFKRFADIDSIDIEIDTKDPEHFINCVKYLGPSWGGINLEDIKAPECFIIEKKLKEVMDIPVFHDDQHGTAVITAAALINACKLTKRKLGDVKVVVNGAGAAGIACANLIVKIGVNINNITFCDTRGVIYKGRKEGMNEWKEKFAIETNKRTLAEALNGADVFLGLSVKGAVTKEMIASMSEKPIIFAMANPDPEILPDEVRSVRSDAIIATGRSDFENQVNNVMGFPYIFRGALDVRAKMINDEMMIAAAEAIAVLARKPVSEEVSKAYSGRKLSFGPSYIIPAPFDSRLMQEVSYAVAKAAVLTNVARIKNFDLAEYKKHLEHRLNPNSNYMNLIFQRISKNPQKVIFADGEEEEAIKAAILMRDKGYGYPILVGAQSKIESVVEKMGDNFDIDGIEIRNAANSEHLDEYIDFLYTRLQRSGFLHRDCARLVKRDRIIFASVMLAKNHADALVTGLNKSYFNSLDDISKVIDKKPSHMIFSYSILITKDKNLIVSDSSVNETPSAEELADIAVQTAEIAKQMGYVPRVALLAYSNFGNPKKGKSERIREAVNILDHKKLDFEYEGEMSPDVALNSNMMRLYPFCRLKGPANVLIMPALNTASVSIKMFQELSEGSVIGPILTGFSKPVQVAHMGSSAEDILYLAAFAATEAINKKGL